ncbi:MAG: hypothetical protein A2Y10_10920 [Planctomycetes bacterium GWF2_41_51]|nr:MAG: hypothetical protein A2Y10_10920 [Planctomycetes bacterium GWF2_41_51]HBG28441.1 hypothetical protein [Phycisphaerales bacterium]
MTIKRTISVCLSVVILMAGFCCAQDKVDLKLRLKAGDSHEMKMTQTQDIAQTMGGQEIKMKQTQEMILGMDCLSVDENGIMEIKMAYKSMKMSMEGPMGRMEFDSANPKGIDSNNPQEKMMAGIFSAMVGSEFQMKVKPTGETSDVRGISEMMNKLKKQMPAEQMQGAEKFIEKMFDESQVKELTGNMMTMYPENSVAVGDSWYETKSINFMLPIDIDTTYMLKSLKDDTAIIDVVSKMDMGDTSKPLDIDPNNKMSMQLSGTMNGASEVDVKTGLTKKSNMTMNFSGMIKMEANEQMPQGMTMPMSIKGDIVVELIK